MPLIAPPGPVQVPPRLGDPPRPVDSDAGALLEQKTSAPSEPAYGEGFTVQRAPGVRDVMELA